MTKFAILLATWFGCGRSPFAPGTAGSLGALAIAIPLHAYAGFAPWHFLLLAAALFYPAVWSAGVAARTYKIKDPGFVVIDEVLGQWIALAGARQLNWKSYAAAFFLFRLFDIWKPAPARQLEALPGGLGINADDVMAGIYAALVLFVAGCFNLY
jgi:phosphatidylglycerophosphatase A